MICFLERMTVGNHGSVRQGEQCWQALLVDDYFWCSTTIVYICVYYVYIYILHIWLHLHFYVCMNMYVSQCQHMYIYIYTCIHVFLCIHIYIGGIYSNHNLEIPVDNTQVLFEQQKMLVLLGRLGKLQTILWVINSYSVKPKNVSVLQFSRGDIWICIQISNCHQMIYQDIYQHVHTSWIFDLSVFFTSIII